jgi:hypothetical protein
MTDIDGPSVFGALLDRTRRVEIDNAVGHNA